jgi:hypothetical protein
VKKMNETNAEKLQRIKKETETLWRVSPNLKWIIEQAEKVERYEKALTLALMTLENNNHMNDDYRKIHSIADGE